MISSRTAERLLLIATLLLLFYLTTFRHRNTLTTNPTPHGAKIVILSMTTQETSYDYMSISNKYDYATKHSYDLVWDFRPATKPSDFSKAWDKVDMIRDAVQATLSGRKNYEWVWMLDFDTLITNFTIPVEEVSERSLVFAESEGKNRDEIQMVLTRDCLPVNGGSMFFRVSPWLLPFLDDWLAGLQREVSEQDVLRDMLPGLQRKSVVVPQTWFDAYPREISECRDERDPGDWEKGMFVVHFAGAKWALPEEKDAVGVLVRRYFWKAFPEKESF